MKRYGRYIGLLLASLCLICGLATSSPAQTVLTWENLQPTDTDLRDPYSHLSTDQTYDLASLAALKTWVETNPGEPSHREAKEARRLEQKLRAQNLDVPALLAQVDQAQAYWQQRAQSPNPQWLNQTVQLSGYALPLQWTQAQRISAFLLVPYVGACIHVPPPPPNQMVYVQLQQAREAPGVFTPVTVVGELKAQPATYELFRTDGSRPVEVSYGLTLDTLAVTAATPPPAPSGLGQRPWWQRLQVRASTILTQAVGNVQQRPSPTTFIWGLLVAFSYGVLHTLGPGHGKAVIITYFVGQGGSLRRGLTMGIKIAVFHVLSAIGVVLVTTLLLQQSVPNNYRLVQVVSYGAIALVGVWMLWRAIPGQQHPTPPTAVAAPRVQSATTQLYPTLEQQVLAQAESRKTRVCSCLTCVEPQGASDWLSLAVGSVPCSGALLILLYGSANQLLWPSIVLVMAISAGMAITLAWIGILALMGRQYTDRRLGHRLGQGQYYRLHQWLKFAGACGVLGLGLGLLGVTLASGG